MSDKKERKFIKQIKIKPMNLGIKTILNLTGIILYAIGLKWFVYTANILPTGLTGLSVLVQKLINEHFNIMIPMTILNMAFNFVPAVFCFFIVGKKFTISSYVIMFLFSLISDYIPYVSLTNDPLICAIFGGLLCGYGASLWFKCGTSGGGTDFIAMSLSSKFHVQTFGWIMIFNIVLILIQGVLYGWTYSFYSIIYQYFQTQALNLSYRHYEARTIFIITENAESISKALIEETGHSSTLIKGIGSYSRNEKTMLYTVITEPETRKIVGTIKKIDPLAFINVVKSNDVQGNFRYLPVDKDVIDTNFGDK